MARLAQVLIFPAVITHNLVDQKSRGFVVLLFKENFKFAVVKKTELFYCCFLQHFVFNHQFSGCSHLSLCRSVFIRAN